MTDDTSRFTFISHDEDSKERKHRLYSHSRNAAIRNKRRQGREALRPAGPLPIKNLTLRPPTTTTDSSASTPPSIAGPSTSVRHPDSTTPSIVFANDAEAGIYPSIDPLWNHSGVATPTQPANNDFYTDAELLEAYPNYLPALNPGSYTTMLHDTSFGAFEDLTSLFSSPQERQRFISDYGDPQSWLQTESVHSVAGILNPMEHDINPNTPSSFVPGTQDYGPQTSHRGLFFGLDLEGEHLGDDDAIIAAFEQQSAPIEEYNEAMMHTIFNDPNTATEDTSQKRDES